MLQFVDGVPVTAYCAAHDLSLRERLSLFRHIVRPVQFAHGRLVVHRDLKPSNILVDSDGTPHLLDFGIAKLLDVDVDDDASLGAATAADVRLFTLDGTAAVLRGGSFDFSGAARRRDSSGRTSSAI